MVHAAGDSVPSPPPPTLSHFGGRGGHSDTGPVPAGVPRWLVASLLALLMLGAALLRFLALSSNPGGLYPDEAAEGYDAQRLLHEPGFHPVFFADDGGREALFGYIVATVFRFTGESILSLRGTAAGVGVAGVLAIWLLTRRFGAWVGLAGAAWAGGSLWLVCISRDGMRNTIVPVFGALALAALLHWCDRPSRRSAMLAGAITALAALYTYQPLKLLPLLLIVWLIWLRRRRPAAYAQLRVNLVAYTVVFGLVSLPMLAAAVSDPANYLGRSVAVTPFSPGAQGDANILVHWLRTLGMFSVTGDPNQRHDVDGLPLLGWPLFLVAGAGLLRLCRFRDDPAHVLILWSLPIFLLPPLVATEGGSPHFLRALGLAAPLAVTVGLGVAELVERVGALWGTLLARVAAAAAAAGLLAVAVAGGHAYLSRPVAERARDFSFDLVALAAAAAHGPGYAVIADDYSATVIRFLDAGNPPTIVPPSTRIARPAVYTQVVGESRDEIGRATDAATAHRAIVVAVDTAGVPQVWAVIP